MSWQGSRDVGTAVGPLAGGFEAAAPESDGAALIDAVAEGRTIDGAAEPALAAAADAGGLVAADEPEQAASPRAATATSAETDRREDLRNVADMAKPPQSTGSGLSSGNRDGRDRSRCAVATRPAGRSAERG